MVSSCYRSASSSSSSWSSNSGNSSKMNVLKTVSVAAGATLLGAAAAFWFCSGEIDVQNHLKKVYLTLCTSLLAAAIGVALHSLLNIGGLLTCLACLGSVLWLQALPPYFFNESKRLRLLTAAAIFKGATVGPLIGAVIEIQPGILITAFVGTALAFACFSGSAILAKNRTYMYLWGLLSSGISILLWLQLASYIFGGSLAVYMFKLYFGLIVFLGYILFDTQIIIARAEQGDGDYIKHALNLFTDFVGVFIRVLAILAKNAKDRAERKMKKRN